VGFITATDRAASKTLTVCLCVCVCVFVCVFEHASQCVCVCACLDRPSTKMASEDYTDWEGINSTVCVCGFDKLFTSLRKQRRHCLCPHLLFSVLKR